MRFFNTAGPCKPDIHYMLPSADRLPGLERLVDMNQMRAHLEGQAVQ